jgi:aminomethyltransferase
VSAGYEAFHNGAALVDLSARGRIEATGEDRARLIHALTTNHIQQLKPGESAYAFFLTAQGRIVADAYVLSFEDKLLLDLEPEVRAALYAHIDHYIIADDVTLEDTTERTFELGLEGPEAKAVLERAAVLNAWPIAADTFRVYGDASARDETIAKLVASGATLATAEEARIARIEHFIPRYGEDITNTTLPQETGLTRALHFSKGCYLGQEIVERIRSRGHVNRTLTGLEIESSEPPEPGVKVMADGAEAGAVTSSAYSPKLGKSVAIAMLRVEQAAKPLSIAEKPASPRPVR